MVRREITHLLTPGVVLDDGLLEPRAPNYLAALMSLGVDMGVGLAWTDISTGEFRVSAVPWSQLASELAKLNPSEVVLDKSMRQFEETETALGVGKKSGRKRQEWI
jgi:DNA mismatch repair protein MutS